MNVAIVCRGFCRSSVILQPWRHIYEISRGMTKRGIRVTIVTDNPTRRSQTEAVADLHIHRLNHFMSTLIIGNKTLTNVILQSDPDAIMWFGDPLSALYLPQLRRVKKPLVWNVYNDIYNAKVLRNISIREIFSLHHRFLWRVMLTVMFPRFIIRTIGNSTFVKRIVVPSRYLKSSLSEIGLNPEKIVIIPSGTEVDNTVDAEVTPSKEKLLENLSVRAEDFVIMYLGPPCTLRGTDTIIRGLPQVLRKHQNVKLIVLSRRRLERVSSEEEHLRKLAKKLEVEQHVRIISGILDAVTVKQLMHASDVITLPFKLLFNEIPLTILEAMSLGKVIITTRFGTLSEIVNDRGILIQPNNPDGLAQAILYLIKNPKESIRLGTNAWQFASNHPNWGHITLQTINLLREVVNDSPVD